MRQTEKPLSPHLSIYRWPITMVLSILHRATGIAMSLGFIVFVAWLYDAAAGPDSYAAFIGLSGSTIGKLLLLGWSFAFFYHLANGARHLYWDTGRGLEKSQANTSAWLVLISAAALTAVFWWVAS